MCHPELVQAQLLNAWLQALLCVFFGRPQSDAAAIRGKLKGHSGFGYATKPKKARRASTMASDAISMSRYKQDDDVLLPASN